MSVFWVIVTLFGAAAFSERISDKGTQKDSILKRKLPP